MRRPISYESLQLPPGQERNWHGLPDNVVPLHASEPDRLAHKANDVAARSYDAWAEVQADSESVTMKLDERTAACVMYAVRLLCADLEAHSRELVLVAQMFPALSYGAANRVEAARRNTRVVQRLQTLDRAYRGAELDQLWGL